MDHSVPLLKLKTREILLPTGGRNGDGALDGYQAVAEQLDMVALNEFQLVRRYRLVDGCLLEGCKDNLCNS